MLNTSVFNDRGNRVTFDRDIVSNADVMAALEHARQKFGDGLQLYGDDPTFVARMARLADDMGITVLNREMEPVIAAHRAALARLAPNVAPPMPQKKNWWRRVLGVRA